MSERTHRLLARRRPRGIRPQLAIVAVAAAAMLASRCVATGDLVLGGYAAAGAAVALAGALYVIYEYERRSAEHERMATLLAGQTEILEMIAMGVPQGEILDALSVMLERLAPGVLCSVLLLDQDRLWQCAAPSLPETYTRAIDGVTIGPAVGSCGTAAYWRKPVVTTDIAHDPSWSGFRTHALEHGLRACWSAPILATDGSCLGTFAMYYREPRDPGRHEWRLIEVAAHLAGVALERRRTEEALTASRQRLEEESQVAGALMRVGHEMISSLSMPLILERLCQLTTELLGCDCSDTVLRQPDSLVYAPNSAHGYAPEQWESLRALRMPSAVLADLLAALEREQLVQVRTARVQNPAAAALLEQYGITVSMYVALKRGDDIIGMLSAAYRGRGELFMPLQQRIAVGIAQLASMALENARLVAQLKSASQLKSEFVSTMSHELRTPLNVIIGYSDVLQEEPEPEERTRALVKIRGASLELLEMIEETLNLNRLEGGKDPPRLEVIAVQTLLDELSSEFAALARKPDTALRWEPADGLELCTDRRKLKVILKNLVGNALKFTPAGEVLVSCRAADEGCVFSVRDSGIGIAPEHLPVIFEMFRQGDSSDARSYSGVGLGLYIVRRLVAQLGGDIGVDSAPGRGTTFTVTLPSAVSEPALSATA